MLCNPDLREVNGEVLHSVFKCMDCMYNEQERLLHIVRKIVWDLFGCRLDFFRLTG